MLGSALFVFSLHSVRLDVSFSDTLQLVIYLATLSVHLAYGLPRFPRVVKAQRGIAYTVGLSLVVLVGLSLFLLCPYNLSLFSKSLSKIWRDIELIRNKNLQKKKISKTTTPITHQPVGTISTEQ